MSYELVTRKCKVCDIKLTEFEYKEKSSLCIECYNEQHEDTKNQNKQASVRRTRNKRFVSFA